MIAAAGAAAGVTDGFGQFAQASTRNAPNGYHTSTAAVTERSLTSQTQVQGTLGHAGAYSVVNPGSGGGSGAGNGTTETSTYTELPAMGKVVLSVPCEKSRICPVTAAVSAPVMVDSTPTTA